jgi:hypothetical protein
LGGRNAVEESLNFRDVRRRIHTAKTDGLRNRPHASLPPSAVFPPAAAPEPSGLDRGREMLGNRQYLGNPTPGLRGRSTPNCQETADVDWNHRQKNGGIPSLFMGANCLSDAEEIEAEYIVKGMKGRTGGNLSPDQPVYVYVF